MAKGRKPEDDLMQPEPWERQDNESEEAFDAFCVYRDMRQGNRSIRKVVQQVGKSLTLIGRWSSTHDWPKRVAAWDAELDRIARQEQLYEILDMRRRHAQIARKALDKVEKALESMDVSEMSNADIDRLMNTASKLERISLGDVGEVIEERDGGQPVSPVQIYIPDNGRGRENDTFDDIEV